jgi:hypothetical protein
VRLEVVSVEGRIIRRLLDRVVAPGRHALEWDGRDAAGNVAASGLYFYRLHTAGRTVTRKMVLLR